MDRKVKENIAKSIPPLAEALREVPTGEISSRDGVFFWNLPGFPVMCVPRESIRAYVDVVRAFQQDSLFRHHLSARKQNSLLEELLAYYGAGGRSHDELLQFIGELEAKAESLVRDWYFYLPIDGLKVSCQPLAMGDHLLLHMHDTVYEELVTSVKAIYDARERSPDEGHMWQSTLARTLGVRDYFVGRPFLRVRMTGDADLVENRAQAECEPILHILTYLLVGFRRSSRKLLLRFGKFPDKQKQIYPLVSVNQSRCRFSSGWPTDIEQVELDDSTLSSLQQLGLDTLVSVFAKRRSVRTQVERLLLRSLRLFYNAYTSLDLVTEFLGYVMILECYLSDGRDSKKKIASRAAALLESDFKSRSALESEVTSLYELRTSIVHGRTETVSNEALDVVFYVAYKLVSVCIKNINAWEKRRDIPKWIRTRRFGSHHVNS